MSNYPWIGEAKKLTDYDIPRIGKIVGVGEDEIHAVLDVESRGTGFDSNGVIKLFESHVFYRQLPATQKSMALGMGLAHTSWSAAKKAGNYKNNHDRFIRAYNFNPEAALKSTSFGLGQIMGFNHNAAGYHSVYDMVLDFAESEANQLEAMILFIKQNRLDDELRRHDWAGFAKGYNGAGYKANRYDTRLANAYAKWQKIKDTKWTPASAAEEERKAEIKPIPQAHTAAIVTSAVAGATGVSQLSLPLWVQVGLVIGVVALAGIVIYNKVRGE